MPSLHSRRTICASEAASKDADSLFPHDIPLIPDHPYSAAVNDGEMEVRGDSLGMMDLSANLGAMEHHAVYEERLFKLIARLGRLNPLRQHRPVRDDERYAYLVTPA